MYLIYHRGVLFYYVDKTNLTKKNTTEYVNNYLGMVEEKKVHVCAGDIYNNNFGDATDKILLTKYTYYKDGSINTTKMMG
jgi:hypothetical protein